VEHQRIIMKRLPRKQLLLKLGVFLLLGVVVNVAVAWGMMNFVAPRTNITRTFFVPSSLGTTTHNLPGTTECGWPMLAFRSEVPLADEFLTTSIEIDDNVFALAPILPGFAINTIFYAAILWLLWFAPGKIRRFIRIRGHRCPACGYQIAPGGGIGPVCSECGAPLPWMKESPT
jgi:hypothetical protein